MNTRRKEEVGKGTDNMAKDGGGRKKPRGGWRSWNEVRAAANDRNGWRWCVHALYATWHEVER